jgi:hypothetical protein
MRCYTLWQFKSIDGKQCVQVVRPTESGEYQNEFCKVLGRKSADTPKQAFGIDQKVVLNNQ